MDGHVAAMEHSPPFQVLQNAVQSRGVSLRTLSEYLVRIILVNVCRSRQCSICKYSKYKHPNLRLYFSRVVDQNKSRTAGNTSIFTGEGAKTLHYCAPFDATDLCSMPSIKAGYNSNGRTFRYFVVTTSIR